MHVAQTLDCSGLSNVPAILRIKQALVGWKDDARMGVLLGEACDADRITGSLGAASSRIELVTATKQ